MWDEEIASKLAEIKRLSVLATGIAPARKSRPQNLSKMDMDHVKELMERLVCLEKEVIESLSARIRDFDLPAARGPLSPIDQDVLSALLNLGCARPQAEAALRKAKTGRATLEFEPLFRRALELVR